VWWQRAQEPSFVDVVELLSGIGAALMVISANVEAIKREVEGDDDEADA